jgi:hypothetical protein
MQNSTFIVALSQFTTLSKNQAVEGGGGAVFWGYDDLETSPEIAEAYSDAGHSNTALYGAYIATPGRILAASKSSYNAYSGVAMSADSIVVELLDE